MNVLRREVVPLACDGRFYSEVIVCKKYPESVSMIVAGKVDVAAINRVTLGLMAQYDSQPATAIWVLAETRSAPSLPYWTRKDAMPSLQDRLRAAKRRCGF